MLKRKLYSFINIFGLALGVAVCLVILYYVDFELSYDSFHHNASNLYRTTVTSYRNGEFRGTSPLSGYMQGPSLLSEIPEVKTYVRTHPMYGGAVMSYKRSSGDPSTFHEDNIQFVDSTFLDAFTYEATQGNLNTALDNPTSIVITKKMVDKYFKPGEDPIGKILEISGGWADGEYEVTAVITKVPDNSHLYFDFLVSTHKLLQNDQYKHDDGWGWHNFVTYIELHPNVNLKNVDEKLAAFVEKHRGKDLASSNGKETLNLQPITNIHLNPGYENESSATTNVNTIYFFVVISIFILAIAWVNTLTCLQPGLLNAHAK